MMEIVVYYIGLGGTVAFAITAILAVAPKGIDLFGACVLGVITCVGGGTLRDVIIDVPVFWAYDHNYIVFSLLASVITFYTYSWFMRDSVNRIILYVDAIGISLFAVAAVEKVWTAGFGLPIAPVILGVVTAIGGGLIRDVLAGRQNLLMAKDIYAIPVLLGCIFYVIILSFYPENKVFGSIVSIALIFSLRAAALHYHWVVPGWLCAKA